MSGKVCKRAKRECGDNQAADGKPVKPVGKVNRVRASYYYKSREKYITGIKVYEHIFQVRDVDGRRVCAICREEPQVNGYDGGKDGLSQEFTLGRQAPGMLFYKF